MGCFPSTRTESKNVETLSTMPTEPNLNPNDFSGERREFVDKINTAKAMITEMAKKGETITDDKISAVLSKTIGLEMAPLINEMMLKIHTSKPDQPDKEQKILTFYKEKLNQDLQLRTIEMLKLSKTIAYARKDTDSYSREIYWLDVVSKVDVYTTRKSIIDTNMTMGLEDRRQSIKSELERKASEREKDKEVKTEVKVVMQSKVFTEIEKEAQKREKEKEVKNEVKGTMQSKVFTEIEKEAQKREKEKEVKTEVKGTMQNKVFTEVEKEVQKREQEKEKKAEVKEGMQNKVFTEVEKEVQKREKEKEVKTEVKVNMQNKVFTEVEKEVQKREQEKEKKAEVKEVMKDKVFSEIEKEAQKKRDILDAQEQRKKSLLENVLRKLPSTTIADLKKIPESEEKK